MAGSGKRKKNAEWTEVDDELFTNLRNAVREFLKSKLSSGEIPDPEHGLYVLGCFVLFDWDASRVSLYHITEDKYQSRIESKPKEKANYYRWSMVEYGTEFICHKELIAIWDAYDIDSIDEESQELAIDEFKGRTQFALIQALKDVERTGLLGISESREKLTLLSGGTNNEESLDYQSLTISVNSLNSAAIADQFIENWMKLIGVEGDAADWVSGLTRLINGKRVKVNKTTLGRLLSKKK